MNNSQHPSAFSHKFPAKTARSYESIERICLRARQRFGYDLGDSIAGWQLFESLGRLNLTVNGKEYPLKYDVAHLPPRVEALAQFSQEEQRFLIVLSNESYEALEQDRTGRPRFTVVHELGHLTLHPRELIELATIPRQAAALGVSQGSCRPEGSSKLA